jgi:hypothetical protein
MAQVHAAALDDQLSQLWHAAGAALALGYTLLLPQFTCFCAKNWWGEMAGVLGSWAVRGSQQEGHARALGPAAFVHPRPKPLFNLLTHAPPLPRPHARYPVERCRLPGDRESVLPFNCSLDQVRAVASSYLFSNCPRPAGAALDACACRHALHHCTPASCPPRQVLDVEALARSNVTVGGARLTFRGPGFARPVRGGGGGAAGWSASVAPGLAGSLTVVRTGPVRCASDSGGGSSDGSRESSSGGSSDADSEGSSSGGGGGGGGGGEDLFSNVQWRRRQLRSRQRRALRRLGDSGAGGPPAGAPCAEAAPATAADAAAAAAAGLPPPAGALALPRGGLDAAGLRAALARAYAGRPPPRWLHLAGDPRETFRGWPDPEASAVHQALIDQISTTWCCRKPAKVASPSDTDSGGSSSKGIDASSRPPPPEAHLLRPRPAWAAAAAPRRACVGAWRGEAVSYFCADGEAALPEAEAL